MSIRRLVGIAIAVSAAAGAVVHSAAAAGDTWVVGPGGGTGRCATPDVATIGAGIRRAGAGDTVVVCAGTYAQKLVIRGAAKDGLTLIADEPWAATIVPPPGTGSMADLLRIRDVSDVRVRWLRFRVPTGDGCRPVNSIIRTMDAQDAQIRANRLLVVGPDTFDESMGSGCGALTAITLVDGSTGAVASNLILDPTLNGIAAEGPDQWFEVVGNSIRYRHPDTSGCLGGSAIILFDADGLVRANRITGPLSPDAVRLCWGIVLHGGSGVSVARGNHIEGTVSGIALQNTSGGRVRGNTIDGAVGGIGLLAYANTGGTLRGNLVTDATIGIVVRGSTDVLLRANDARGSANHDCDDDAAASANTWLDNLGDDPVGSAVCAPG